MKKIYLLIVILLCGLSHLNAQRSSSVFIEKLNETSVVLNATEVNKIENIRTNELYERVELIRVGDLSKIQKYGFFTFSIPGREGNLLAKAHSIKAQSENDYVWEGEFVEEEGTLMIIAKDGNVFGHITLNEEVYEIHDLGNDTNILIKIDTHKFTESECATIDVENTAGTEQSIIQDNLNNLIRQDVRILVLYTHNAQKAVASVNNVAFLAIQQMNSALNNSGITNVDVTLAGVQRLNFTETDNILSDVEDLARNSNAQRLRNTYEADLVLLLTNGSYGSDFGIAADFGPVNSLAYGIVEIDAASGRYTFTHEAAHLFGARHNNDPRSVFAHGYFFKTGWWVFGTERRTIMHTLPKNKSRILHFSNPDVKYKDEASGNSTSNNSRQIKETGAIVAAFRDYTPPLRVVINGPAFGNNTGTYTWRASVSNGITPYVYCWEYSIDGFNYSLFRTSKDVTAPLPYDADLYLRLTVTDNKGEQALAYHFTANNSGGNCIKCFSRSEPVVQNADYEEISMAEDATIYPNPSYGVINIRYETTTINTDVQLQVIDFYGNLVYDQNFKAVKAGLTNKQIDLSDLNKGHYVVKIMTDKGLKTERIIIDK